MYILSLLIPYISASSETAAALPDNPLLNYIKDMFGIGDEVFEYIKYLWDLIPDDYKIPVLVSLLIGKLFMDFLARNLPPYIEKQYIDVNAPFKVRVLSHSWYKRLIIIVQKLALNGKHSKPISDPSVKGYVNGLMFLQWFLNKNASSKNPALDPENVKKEYMDALNDPIKMDALSKKVSDEFYKNRSDDDDDQPMEIKTFAIDGSPVVGNIDGSIESVKAHKKRRFKKR